MKAIIRKLQEHKKLVFSIAAVVVILVAISMTITLLGVRKNMHKLADQAAHEETPFYPTYPKVDTSGPNGDLIKRGEYLAKAGDCIACHTDTLKKGSKPFAGGLPMTTPFGTLYTPNITPDKETGIGNWTQKEFDRSMQHGVSPSGHFYYPAFPYLYFAEITPNDLKALKAYLDSIPAVHQENRTDEMVWPFNQRILQIGWRLLFFHSQASTYHEDPNHSAQWNRGAYLVKGLGHCSMCHSPSYNILSDSLPLGAPIRKYEFTGAKVGGYYAPNISKSNLKDVPTDKVVQVFTEDKMIGGGNIKGPMLEVNHDSLRYLSHQDLQAIAIYLKSIQSKTPPLKKSSGGPGQAVYDTYCSGCHTTGAGGAPTLGSASQWEPILQLGIEQVYKNAIHGIGGMPAKGTCLTCTDEQIKQAVDYMVAATKGGGNPSVVAPPKSTIVPLTIADGKKVYDAHCSLCHNNGYKGAPKLGDLAQWQPIIKAGFPTAYVHSVEGYGNHPPQGNCPECTDAEIKAAVKYMMQESSPDDKDYSLW